MLSRNVNIITKKLINKQYKDLINVENILKLSRFKINNIFKDEDDKIRNIYIHNVLAKWIDLQEEHDEKFFLILNKMIRKTKIDISDEERHDLFLLEERAFSSVRHFKIIEVDYNLTPKEVVGAKYIGSQLYKRTGTKFKMILEDDLLISNRRIIFPNNHVSYKFSTIESYWYKDYGFEFKFQNDIFVIRIHDQETLNNSIENVISRKVKNAIRKRKDN